MQVPRRTWNKIIGKLKAVNNEAIWEMKRYMNSNPYADMQTIVMVANAITAKYGEAAASISCDLYDAIAEVSKARVPSAEPATTATYGEVAKSVYGSAKTSPLVVPQSVGRLVKMAGADTMLQNAKRDRAQFAWIPSGDSCAFCITLASRGWQYMGKEAMKGNHAIHIHANCDCEYAVRFSEKDGVEGYDPQKYRDMYYGAEGNTPQERINAMRRAQYAQQKKIAGTESTSMVDALLSGKQKPVTQLLSVLTGSDSTIPYMEVKSLTKTLSAEDIINKIGGGDMTKGSCSSLAFSYAANKNGLDVTDFRGGNSCFVFSKDNFINQVLGLGGGEFSEHKNGFTAANQLLDKVQEGKEYYFAAGQHASIVRRTKNGLEYLELQSATSNGYKPLDNTVLKKRFGVVKTRKFMRETINSRASMADISKFKDNDEFRALMGFINNDPSKQKKGMAGYAK